MADTAEHITESGSFHEQDGWWHARCTCGLDLGVFPDAETGCDALMDHAWDAAYREAAERAADA